MPKFPMRRRLLIASLASPLIAAVSGRASAAPVQADLAADLQTGRILARHSADTPVHPASLAKLMTLHLAFTALETGAATPDTPVMFSARAAARPNTRLGLAEGSSIRLGDAVFALAVHSCNDVATAVAELLGGSEERFAAMMNTHAAALGLARTHFANASGLPDPANRSTARELVLLGVSLMARHPQSLGCLGTASWTYAGKTYRNTSGLLPSYPGMDVAKTGYTAQSGFNLFASASRGGRRVAACVTGGVTAAARDARMAALLDAALGTDGQGAG